MNTKTSEKTTNGKAIGSLLIGIVSIFGLIFVEEGTLLSIVGLMLGVISLKETKQFKQIGRKIALVGIAFNLIGLISIVVSYII
ncbi:DUF4190 domain-containing protein [Bacillus sp. AK128]